MILFVYWVLALCILVKNPSHAEPLWSSVCQEEPVSDFPFCDESLPLEARVGDYVSRVPVENQIKMMGNRADGYDELGIPSYQWWSEGLHGPLQPCLQVDGSCRCPTSFPAPTGSGNSFNTTLYRLLGEAISREGKAISNLRNHDARIGDGLTYWSPTINLQRDPRWGRNQEVPGEDPLNVGRYAKEFVAGLQGTGEKLNVAACCKHFVANSLERWKGYSRHSFDARISEADLRSYYLPPFEECVKAGAVGVMCSYNAVNGVASCHNQYLLKDLLRGEWQFDGYVVTDCGALNDTITGHKDSIDEVEASAKAVQATVDVNCGRIYGLGLLKAYKGGWLEASEITESFHRLARIQFNLGLFDSKESDPDQDMATVGSHDTLALEAAQQSIVLLQNKKNLLPLDSSQKVAVIGPHAFGRSVFLSNYHGDRCCGSGGKPCYDCIEAPAEAIQRYSTELVEAVVGCDVSGTKLNEIEKAVAAAIKADVVILTVGLDQTQEGEERDRVETRLPGLQEQLVKAVLEVASEKTILTLIHGGALALGKDIIGMAPTILSSSYGGQAASKALTSVFYGEYNPTGKLSATMYPPSFVDDLPLTEMGLQVGVGRTYMYYKGEPEFQFGHGLSYSTWSLEWADADNEGFLKLAPTKTIEVTLNVTNEGPLDGSQSILLFWRPISSSQSSLQRKLADFAGTSLLKAGDSQLVTMTISADAFAVWDENRKTLEAVPGMYSLEARAAGPTQITRQIEINVDWPQEDVLSMSR